MTNKWPDDVPKIREIVFPDTRIFVDVWCSICSFGFQPTGWYDSDGEHITFDMLIALWQDVHDDEGACKCEISYKILEKEHNGIVEEDPE